MVVDQDKKKKERHGSGGMGEELKFEDLSGAAPKVDAVIRRANSANRLAKVEEERLARKRR